MIKTKINISNIFLIINLIISILLISSIIYLNVLKISLLLLVIIFIIGIFLISIFLTLKTNLKRLGLILSIILTLTYSILSFYLIKTNYLLNSININSKDTFKDIDVINEPFNIYLSGIDTYGSIKENSRSDVNMIISVNPKTKEILLVSIPRDYYVSIPRKSLYKDKLTHTSLYGIDISIKTVENLLDCNINYYIKVNFTSLINIIDAIGGINVYSSYTFTSKDNFNYKKGYNKINGEQALSFARERKAFTLGDRQRTSNQQEVFKAIFNKVKSKEIITRYIKILNSLEDSIITNMPKNRLTSLIKTQISNNYSWNINTYTLEGTDSYNYTYSNKSEKSYVMMPIEESISIASSLIKNIEKGESNDKVSYVSKEENLRVKLVRDNFTLVKGNEYIYHGYMVYYNNKDITNNKSIKELFSINGKNFNDYKDLVSYITYNLDIGEYYINYKITYMDETKIVKQKLIIIE